MTTTLRVTQARRRSVRERLDPRVRPLLKVQLFLHKISVSLHSGRLRGVHLLLAAALAVEAVG